MANIQVNQLPESTDISSEDFVHIKKTDLVDYKVKQKNLMLIGIQDTKASLTTSNPILKRGQFSLETDTKVVKIGDGVTPYNLLSPASNLATESITPVGDVAILDLASATVFRVTLNAHITQIGFANASGEDGASRSVTLILRQGTGVNLVSWPENIRWAYGHLPVLSYEKDAEDYITLVRFGADAHWYGFLTGGWFHV